MDVRTGGKYRLEFGAGGSDTMAFYGKYLEVVPDERIVWTNDEGEEGAITTVTFEDQGGKTLLIFHEVYPSKDALEEALQGAAAGTAGAAGAAGRTAFRHRRVEQVRTAKRPQEIGVLELAGIGFAYYRLLSRLLPTSPARALEVPPPALQPD
jgi:hypothetical protein